MTLADDELATVLTEAYGSPEWTLADVCAARAIESAATAPLLARIAELGKLCDETYVKQGADAYNNACDEMERWQKQRKADGKEVGTTGSLCDGIAWLYLHVSKLERGLEEARKDAERFVKFTSGKANVMQQMIDALCSKTETDTDWWRAAIDAAIKE